MWAHYSANHTGFVIELDEKHPWFWQRKTGKDDFRHLRKVSYVEHARSPCLAELDGGDVFYSKLKDWEYEQEWRIIRALQDACVRFGDDIFLFDLPPDCVCGVIKGVRMHEVVATELKRILEANPALRHVYTGQATISKATNTIEIAPD